ncbi:TY3B-TY3B protein [Mycena sanguinolenta]|uniref:TY3B-TY3B protein n=1 Tax=Mycena sanguinolenta TaxID=230812 RepID=A0A8H6Z8X7_9AGAR|nr:TY3B-TY3B protein [Mycena sanguinolenta]
MSRDPPDSTARTTRATSSPTPLLSSSPQLDPDAPVNTKNPRAMIAAIRGMLSHARAAKKNLTVAAYAECFSLLDSLDSLLNDGDHISSVLSAFKNDLLSQIHSSFTRSSAPSYSTVASSTPRAPSTPDSVPPSPPPSRRNEFVISLDKQDELLSLPGAAIKEKLEIALSSTGIPKLKDAKLKGVKVLARGRLLVAADNEKTSALLKQSAPHWTPKLSKSSRLVTPRYQVVVNSVPRNISYFQLSSLRTMPSDDTERPRSRPQSRSSADRAPSPADRSANSTIPDLAPDQAFNLPALENYTGPIDEDEVKVSSSPEDITLDWPALKSISKIGGNTEIQARRLQAIVLGCHAIGKGFLVNAQKAGRKLYRDKFPEEFDLLDRVLSDVQRIDLASIDAHAFRLDRNEYELLVNVLADLRQISTEGFQLAGKALPTIPTWGEDEDPSEYYRQNNFEILAICFRVEVENFLALLDKYYDFAARKPQPRNDDLQARLAAFHKKGAAGSAPGSPAGKRSRSPVEQDRMKDEELEDRGVSRSRYRSMGPPSHGKFGATARNRGLPQGNRRINEILAPVASLYNNSNSRVTRGHSSVPEEVAQMDRMDSRDNRNFRDKPPHMFGTGGAPPSGPRNRSHPNGDPDDSSSDDDGGFPPRRSNPVPPVGGRRPIPRPAQVQTSSTKETHFDLKLKYENVPKWDGNTDTIMRWFLKVTDLAKESETVFKQLGRVVPKRLEGDAEVWYWSLPDDYRTEIEQDWDSLRDAFATYYLNRRWLDRQRGRANRASYQQAGHARETPSQYYIRKTELLNMVRTLEDSELILEVMDGAPSTWNTILTTQFYKSAVEFQAAIRYHEDALMKLDKDEKNYSYRERERDRDREKDRESYPRAARVNLVGWSANLPTPPFPKDDRNVSKKATPESKGARPCRHCGSGKHWDNECKHSYRGNRAARANLASATGEDRDAQGAYDDLYYGLGDESEDESEQPGQGFEIPLQPTEAQTFSVDSSKEDVGITSALEGETEIESKESPRIVEDELNSSESEPRSNQPEVRNSCTSYRTKPSLNHRSRRRLAKEIKVVNFRVLHSLSSDPDKTLIELRKHMARPPGSAFLGAIATEVPATVGGLNTDPVIVIADSGSDITLISRKALQELTNPPKIKAGHDVKLIQVTGKSSISGFVNLDLYFHTEDGPVKIAVEAYVVNGMSTPLILGNDFTDQFWKRDASQILYLLTVS